MDEVFADYKEWMIVIFDNLLVLATDFQDLYHKLVKVIDRCHDRHVILKMEKSWIGVKSATFFGYEVSGGGYRLSQKRREHIASIPMPKDTKGMQRFLGAALYFKTHIPNYSGLTADLNEMVHKDFDWNEATWRKDYKGAMERLKEAVMQSATCTSPTTLSLGFFVVMRRIRPAAVHYFRSGSRTSSGPRSGRSLPSSRRSSPERPSDGIFRRRRPTRSSTRSRSWPTTWRASSSL